MKNPIKKNSIYKQAILALVIFIGATFFFSLFLQSSEKTQELSLGELVARINLGEVVKIVVNGNELRVDLSNGDKAISKKEEGADITDVFSNYGVNLAERQVNIEIQDESGLRFWLGILIPTILPFLIIGFFFWWMFRQAKGGVNQAFSFGKSSARLFSSFRDKITFKDVAGLKEVKQELEEIVDFLKNPKKFLEIGAKIPRGAILMGPPGTGKTLVARAVAGEANVPFFYMSASEFVEMFVGVGASRVRDLFDTAKKAAPSIVFIDEIDAVGRERGAGLGGGHDEREQTLNQILVEMDGFDRDTRVIVVAATNRPDILDRALLRPGRFDRRIVLDLPDINEREEILRIHSKGKALSKDVDLRRVAVRTPGFSGADLANLMNEAAISSARENQKTINQQTILISIEKVILGPERKGRAILQKEKEITAYHEAGHALVAASLKDADPVQKVSIISRGRAGGYTLKLPLEEKRLKLKNQFLADLSVALGGYVSEEATFGDISTGSSNDLKEASALARMLVTHYGMSNLGPITFGRQHDMIFLGREMTAEKDYSEKTAEEIDKEVSNFLKLAYMTAKKIIISRKKALKAIANALIERETLEHEDFYGILRPFKLKPVAI
ncbi:MAG: ATP-dependent zinc metalloprotease FtsH [Candidatus Liptonbacteria bacterium]|nr:ATP-dependent zinc metalloprotease FtsH [Candidatus Liptonbacteria bacterium]